MVSPDICSTYLAWVIYSVTCVLCHALAFKAWVRIDRALLINELRDLERFLLNSNLSPSWKGGTGIEIYDRIHTYAVCIHAIHVDLHIVE